MKKVCVILLIVVMVMAMTIPAIAETRMNFIQARELIEEWAKKEELYNWIDGRFDANSGIRYGLLTGDKEYLKENYGFDFDKESLTDFEKVYEETAKKNGFDVEVKCVKCDVYKNVNIYELLITSNEDMEPDIEGETTTGRAFFIMY